MVLVVNIAELRIFTRYVFHVKMSQVLKTLLSNINLFDPPILKCNPKVIQNLQIENDKANCRRPSPTDAFKAI